MHWSSHAPASTFLTFLELRVAQNSLASGHGRPPTPDARGQRARAPEPNSVPTLTRTSTCRATRTLGGPCARAAAAAAGRLDCTWTAVVVVVRWPGRTFRCALSETCGLLLLSSPAASVTPDFLCARAARAAVANTSASDEARDAAYLSSH